MGRSIQESAELTLQITSSPSISETERERLESKIKEVFEDELKTLSEEMQSAFAADIVTAFLTRFSLLIEIEARNKEVHVHKTNFESINSK